MIYSCCFPILFSQIDIVIDIWFTSRFPSLINFYHNYDVYLRYLLNFPRYSYIVSKLLFVVIIIYSCDICYTSHIILILCQNFKSVILIITYIIVRDISNLSTFCSKFYRFVFPKIIYKIKYPAYYHSYAKIILETSGGIVIILYSYHI